MVDFVGLCQHNIMMLEHNGVCVSAGLFVSAFVQPQEEQAGEEGKG